MKPVAVVIMIGIVVAWLGALGLVLYLRYPCGMALFALAALAAFLRWNRLG